MYSQGFQFLCVDGRFPKYSHICIAVCSLSILQIFMCINAAILGSSFPLNFPACVMLHGTSICLANFTMSNDACASMHIAMYV